MKIKIIKDCTFSGIRAKAGQNATVQRELGIELIERGDAEGSDYVSQRENYATAISAEQAYGIIEHLPEQAGKLVKEIRLLVNRTVLTLLAEDKRKTVRRAALKRIAELS